MATQKYAKFVAGCWEELQGSRLKYSVYRVLGRYYASWLCTTCAMRGDTNTYAIMSEALGAGHAAVTAHHAECRRAERRQRSA